MLTCSFTWSQNWMVSVAAWSSPITVGVGGRLKEGIESFRDPDSERGGTVTTGAEIFHSSIWKYLYWLIDSSTFESKASNWISHYSSDSLSSILLRTLRMAWDWREDKRWAVHLFDRIIFSFLLPVISIEILSKGIIISYSQFIICHWRSRSTISQTLHY